MLSTADEEGEIREPNSVLACLECVRELHSDLSLVDVCVLMLVAERPGVSVSEIESCLGIAKLTVSRALRAFATDDFPNALPPALGLIELRRNAPNGRSLTAWLTDRGERLVEELNACIARGVQI
jgi:DNA-binding MarR family transcriptional regulator